MHVIKCLRTKIVGACRPDYKKLGVLKQQFRDVPLLALTATATERVCQAHDLSPLLASPSILLCPQALMQCSLQQVLQS